MDVIKSLQDNFNIKDNGLYSKNNFKTKKCIDCGVLFKPKSSRAFRCGSKKNKTGCSYKNRLDLSIKSQKLHKEHRSDYMYDYNFKKRKELQEYRKKHYESRKEFVKNYRLLKEYGISLEEYNKKLQEQEGLCSICKKHFSEFQKGLVVDHCHTSGGVRGLLCSKCNTGIGLLLEDEVILLECIKYLKKWKQ